MTILTLSYDDGNATPKNNVGWADEISVFISPHQQEIISQRGGTRDIRFGSDTGAVPQLTFYTQTIGKFNKQFKKINCALCKEFQRLD